jgi:ferredoxin
MRAETRRAGRGDLAVTYIITEPCIDVMDKSCVEVCPVDCIHESGRMLVIDPEECIDCGACEPECPVEAIFPEDAVPDAMEPFVKINYAFTDGLEVVAKLVDARIASSPPPPIEGHRE